MRLACPEQLVLVAGASAEIARASVRRATAEFGFRPSPGDPEGRSRVRSWLRPSGARPRATGSPRGPKRSASENVPSSIFTWASAARTRRPLDGRLRRHERDGPLERGDRPGAVAGRPAVAARAARGAARARTRRAARRGASITDLDERGRPSRPAGRERGLRGPDLERASASRRCSVARAPGRPLRRPAGRSSASASSR